MNTSKFQKEVEKYVRSLGFKKVFTNRKPFSVVLTEAESKKVGQETIFPDIYIQDINLIIECFGDYWHCSEKYEDDYFHKVLGKTAKEIRKQDKKRMKLLRDKGMETMVIWESEWNNNKRSVKQKIRYRKNKIA